MKWIQIIFGLLFITNSILAQNLQLDIHKHTLLDFINQEKRNGSARFDNESDFFSEKGVAQPIIFRHKEKIIPDRLSYYYYQKDSSIDYVLYEWDNNNFKNDENSSIKKTNEVKAFINYYKSLYKLISKKYGKSKSTGKLGGSIKHKFFDIEKMDLWNLKNTEIQLYTTLANSVEQRGSFTIEPTYRIRLYLRILEAINT